MSLSLKRLLPSQVENTAAEIITAEIATASSDPKNLIKATTTVSALASTLTAKALASKISRTTTSITQPSTPSVAKTERIAPILRLPPDILHYLLVLSCSPPPSSPNTSCTCAPPCINICSPPAQPWLTFASLISLRLTHRNFTNILTSPFLAQLRGLLVARYLSLESYTHGQWLTSLTPHARWLRLHDAWFDRPCSRLRCYRCLEVKPLQGFTSRHARKGLGLGGGQAGRRWCKRCLIEGGRVGWGRWERENWIERSELAMYRGRQGRKLRWSLPQRGTEAEVDKTLTVHESRPGICSRCHLTPYELWWGCVGCFEKEEKRRQDQDRMDVGKVGSGLLGTVQTLRKAKGKWKKMRGPRSEMHWVWIWEREFWSQLMEFSRGRRRRGRYDEASIFDTPVLTVQDRPERERQEVAWRPSPLAPTSDVVPHPSRREIRCGNCWIPNCPRRRWVLGLAYERPLPKERWCENCKNEKEARLLQRRRRINEDAASMESTDALGLVSLFED